MLKKNSLALFTLAALLTACASGPDLRSDYDRTADFTQYRTFGFVVPLGTDKSGYSSLVTSHFKGAVTREMESRGYVLNQANPDLLVNFSVSARTQTDVQSTPSVAPMGMGMGGYYGYRGGMYAPWPMYATNDVSSITYKVGTANIDVVDAKRKQLVWEGVAEGRLKEESLQNPGPAIDSAVVQIFASYPARAGAVASAPAKK
ncbi:MAG: hypothetical protein RL030_1945 [Pseudomonadota bacterium]